MPKPRLIQRPRGFTALPKAALVLLASVILISSATAHPCWRPHGLRQVGTASWYGERHADHATASGAGFDPARMTAADRFLPLGTTVRVTNLRNQRSVTVRIRDRGPYVRGRLIDLSEAAARELGMKHKGVARVRVEVLSACARGQAAAEE
ncbi:MAG: septal ring lytic transglycosylase RlpA family protein [Alphaproteobacteria bacterium]|nr:septal ring lytic transglycosylase RlpA family protein [Alphaproteobacteria bacterium]